MPFANNPVPKQGNIAESVKAGGIPRFPSHVIEQFFEAIKAANSCPRWFVENTKVELALSSRTK
jgi:hypothetical protein